MIQKKLCRVQIECEGSDECFRPKCIICNHEKTSQVGKYSKILLQSKFGLIPFDIKCGSESGR